jgi:hypothetical protein
MKEVATQSAGFGLINREDLAKALNNAATSMPNVGGDKQYIKMLTKGRDAGTWVFGQQETEVEEGSLWAINPASIKHGYVAWDTHGGGAPVAEIMVSVNRQLPSIDSLPELPAGTPSKKAPGVPVTLEYAAQRSFDAVCVSGEDQGVSVEYKQSSTGAMKLFNKLVNDMLDRIQKGDEIVPIGKWGFSSYEHKTYGEIYNPEFEIVEWRTIEDASPPEGDEAEAVADTPTAADDELAKAYETEAAAQSADTPRRRQRR